MHLQPFLDDVEAAQSLIAEHLLIDGGPHYQPQETANYPSSRGSLLDAPTFQTLAPGPTQSESRSVVSDPQSRLSASLFFV